MINVYIANLGKYNEGELVGSWLKLPAADEQINYCFVKAKLGKYIDGEYVHGLEEGYSFYEEYAMHDYETSYDFLKISEYDNLNELNKLASELESLSHEELELFEAVQEYETMDINTFLEKKDDFILYDNINDEEDLGYYYIEEAGIYDLEKLGNLANYIDYEKFGRDITFDGKGCFTKYGWLEYIA